MEIVISWARMARRGSCLVLNCFVFFFIVFFSNALLASFSQVAGGIEAVSNEEDRSVAPRPRITVTLTTGQVWQGELLSFNNGCYTIVAPGRSWSFHESHARSIVFESAAEASRIAKPSPVVTPAPIAEAEKTASPGNELRLTEADEQRIAELVAAFAHPAPGVDDRSYGDELLVTKLAAQGPAVIRPLIREVAKNRRLYRNVGKVFQLLGPEHFPVMIHEVTLGTPGAAEPFFNALESTGVASVPTLRLLLDHRDSNVRELSLGALYNLGSTSGNILPRSLTPVLIEKLDDPELKVRMRVPAIMARVANPIAEIAPPLLAAIRLESNRRDIAYPSILALSSLGSKLRTTDPWRVKIDEAMLAGLSDPNSSIRSSSAYYFGRLDERPSEAIIEGLRQAAGDPAEFVRKRARTSLHHFDIAPDPKSAASKIKTLTDEELVGLLSNEDSVVMRDAVKQLMVTVPSRRLLRLLMDSAASDHRGTYWNQIPWILASWKGDFEAAWLEEYATHESSRVRGVVASTYAKIGLKQFPLTLDQLVLDSEIMVRSEAILTLGTLATQSKGEVFGSAVVLLLESIQDTTIHRQYHWKACDALVEVGVGHPAVLPALIKLAHESGNAVLREAMIEAIGEIGSGLKLDSAPAKEVVDALLILLEQERVVDLKIEVIRALGSINSDSPRVLTALESASSDSRKFVSMAAQESLQRVRERRKRKAEPPTKDSENPFGPNR